MATVYTLEGSRKSKKRKSSSSRSLAVGECKWVPTGRKKTHEIQLCRTGRGKSGYQFKSGTRRPKR